MGGEIPNIKYLLGIQESIALPLPACGPFRIAMEPVPRPCRQSSFLPCIRRILFVRPEPQMSGIDAQAIVPTRTVVQDIQASLDVAMGQYPTHTIGPQHGTPAIYEDS